MHFFSLSIERKNKYPMSLFYQSRNSVDTSSTVTITAANTPSPPSSIFLKRILSFLPNPGAVPSTGNPTSGLERSNSSGKSTTANSKKMKPASSRPNPAIMRPRVDVSALPIPRAGPHSFRLSPTLPRSPVPLPLANLPSISSTLPPPAPPTQEEQDMVLATAPMLMPSLSRRGKSGLLMNPNLNRTPSPDSGSGEGDTPEGDGEEDGDEHDDEAEEEEEEEDDSSSPSSSRRPSFDASPSVESSIISTSTSTSTSTAPSPPPLPAPSSSGPTPDYFSISLHPPSPKPAQAPLATPRQRDYTPTPSLGLALVGASASTSNLLAPPPKSPKRPKMYSQPSQSLLNLPSSSSSSSPPPMASRAKRTSLPSIPALPPIPTFSPLSLSNPPPPYPLPLNEPPDILPSYTCALHIEGYFHRKIEFSAPGVQSKDRSWNKCYLVLNGTGLRVYKRDVRKYPPPPVVVHERRKGKGKGRSPREWKGVEGESDVDVESRLVWLPKEARRKSNASSLSPPNSHSILNGNGNRSMLNLNSSASSSNSGETSTSTPNGFFARHRASASSSFSITTSRFRAVSSSSSSSPPQSSPPHAHRTSISTTASSEFSQKYIDPSTPPPTLSSFTNPRSHIPPLPSHHIPHPPLPTPKKSNPLLHTYTLQKAESGLASDYLKHQNTIRIRVEGEQWLIRGAGAEGWNMDGVVRWIEALQVGAGLSLDLDERVMPRGPLFPRRRRRNRGAAGGAASAGRAAREVISAVEAEAEREARANTVGVEIGPAGGAGGSGRVATSQPPPPPPSRLIVR